MKIGCVQTIFFDIREYYKISEFKILRVDCNDYLFCIREKWENLLHTLLASAVDCMNVCYVCIRNPC